MAEMNGYFSSYQEEGEEEESETNESDSKEKFSCVLIQTPFVVGIDHETLSLGERNRSRKKSLSSTFTSLDDHLIESFWRAVEGEQQADDREATETSWQHNRTLRRVLANMWRESKFCDLVLVSSARDSKGNASVSSSPREILAHRLVLAWHSPKAK